MFTYIVDVVAFALVSVGLTLTDPRTEKEVVLFDEITMESLGTKLDFLRSNGFSIIAARAKSSIEKQQQQQRRKGEPT